MRTELQWYNELQKDDRSACREHFLKTGWDSSYYGSLGEALQSSIDWENLDQQSPDYFLFSYLVEQNNPITVNK